MRNRILSLSNNEDFKSILSGRKITNKYLTIFFRKLSDKNRKKIKFKYCNKKKNWKCSFKK